MLVCFAQWIGSFLGGVEERALAIGDTALFYNDIPLH